MYIQTDFQLQSPLQSKFSPGVTSGDVMKMVITVFRDAIIEDDEVFSLCLETNEDPLNNPFSNTTTLVTILSPDGKAVWSV